MDALPANYQLVTFNFAFQYIQFNLQKFKMPQTEENHLLFQHHSETSYFPSKLSIPTTVANINASLNRLDVMCQISEKEVFNKFFADVVIKVQTNPYQKAVYLSGADIALGEWKEALRLSYDWIHCCWKFYLPQGVKKREVIFYTGSLKLGKLVDVGLLSKQTHATPRLLPIQVPSDIVMIVPNQPAKKVVYITGEDEFLGNGKTAKRLLFNDYLKQWQFFLPAGVSERGIKFFEGKPELGEKVSLEQLDREIEEDTARSSHKL